MGPEACPEGAAGQTRVRDGLLGDVTGQPHLSLCQEADDPIVRAQQEVAFGGQQGQASERASEVLRAELGGGLGRWLKEGTDADLVGHRAGDHLAAVQVEGVDGVRR